MEKTAAFLAKNFLSILGITILTGATVTTSVMGVAKVASTLHPTQLEVPVQHSADSSSASSVSSASSSTSSVFSQGSSRSGTTVKTLAPVILPAASSVSSQSSTGNGPQTSANQCIITLFGKQYDVSSLRNSHSGGNVFICGTDQTALYQSQHGTDLSRMQQYLVTSGGTTSSTGGGNSSSFSSIQRGGEGEKENEKEHRDEDHQEEVETHSESRLPAVWMGQLYAYL